jgi:hypothetical protein
MACKSGRREDYQEHSQKQFVYAMNDKSNGKSQLIYQKPKIRIGTPYEKQSIDTRQSL